MPETNLNTHDSRTNETLAAQAGLDAGDVNQNKPLLLQILEQFKQGGRGLAKG
jgi:hypothetical protein